MRKTLALGALAALALAALAPRASAANNEIYLGFRSADVTPDKDLVVNLGLFSSLTTRTPGTIITNINADLVATFGANWNTRTDLFFGAAGSNTISGFRTVYASNFVDGYTGSNTLSVLNSTTGAISVIDQVLWNSTNGIQSNKGVSGVNTLVSIQDDTNASGWSSKLTTGPSAFNNTTMPLSEFETDTDFSVVTKKSFSISTYTQGQTAWVNNVNSVSYFLDSAGNIGVNASAVPEPSTYGLMGAGALAAASYVRRRRKAAGAAKKAA